MKRFVAFAPLAALVLIAAASIAVLMQGGERDMVSADGLTGQPTPAYALAPLTGEGVIAPERFAGRAYVINLFASWCAPCEVEHPLLMQMQAAGVPILGIAYKDRPENAARFLRRLGNPYEIAGLDPEGRYALEIGVAGVPETFVVGADGRLIALYRGELTEEIVRTRIMPALAEGAGR